MVFVHAKIGDLKVKDLSQKLQGISGFIFHLQLCEGQQLKHQILLKANTESVTFYHCLSVRVRVKVDVVLGADGALTDFLFCVFVCLLFVRLFNKERKAKMDHSHVSI